MARELLSSIQVEDRSFLNATLTSRVYEQNSLLKISKLVL